MHQLHFIWKPYGSIRTTADFSHGFNKGVIPSHHPIPLPKDILNQIGENQCFQSLYWHLELHPDPHPPTAFLIERNGLCQFKRLPMGLTDSEAAFQKRVEMCLEGLEGVHVYIDDIRIRGRTREEHDRRLRQVLHRLERNGFRLNSSIKQMTSQQSISILGNILTATPFGKRISHIRNPQNPLSIFLHQQTFMKSDSS